MESGRGRRVVVGIGTSWDAAANRPSPAETAERLCRVTPRRARVGARPLSPGRSLARLETEVQWRRQAEQVLSTGTRPRGRRVVGVVAAQPVPGRSATAGADRSVVHRRPHRGGGPGAGGLHPARAQQPPDQRHRAGVRLPAHDRGQPRPRPQQPRLRLPAAPAARRSRTSRRRGPGRRRTRTGARSSPPCVRSPAAPARLPRHALLPRHGRRRRGGGPRAVPQLGQDPPAPRPARAGAAAGGHQMTARPTPRPPSGGCAARSSPPRSARPSPDLFERVVDVGGGRPRASPLRPRRRGRRGGPDAPWSSPPSWRSRRARTVGS